MQSLFRISVFCSSQKTEPETYIAGAKNRISLLGVARRGSRGCLAGRRGLRVWSGSGRPGGSGGRAAASRRGQRGGQRGRGRLSERRESREFNSSVSSVSAAQRITHFSQVALDASRPVLYVAQFLSHMKETGWAIEHIQQSILFVF